MIALKFLRSEGTAIFSGRSWTLPSPNEPGPWLEASVGPLVPCVNGVHASAPDDLAFWLAEELWQVELAGEMITGPQSIVARRGRLLHKIEAWNAQTALELARAAVERARDAIDRAGDAASDTARAYLEEARGFVARGDGIVGTYAAALAVSALSDAAGADEAFRAERRAQSLLLAPLLKLEM